MINRFIKVICLCTLLIISLGVKASASDAIDNEFKIIEEMSKNDYNEIFELIKVFCNDSDCCELKKEDISNLRLSSLFQIPTLCNDSLNSDDSMWYSAVLNGSKVEAIISFVVDDGELFYSISNDGIDIINDSVRDKSLIFFNKHKLVRASCNDVKSLSKKNNIKNSIDNNFILSVNKLFSNNYQTYIERNSIDGSSKKIKKSVTDKPYGKYLEGYPIYSQGLSKVCWAASIASMAKYKYPQKYQYITVNDVCDSIGNRKGATTSQIREAMMNFIKAPYYVCKTENYLSRSDIKNTISNDMPALMVSIGKENGTDYRHATVLIGYMLDGKGNMKVKIMNPGTGKLEWGKYCNYAPYTYTYCGTTYKWDKTIRINKR